jgi:GTP:adenosylcobinamide-phosphate guanylyltransferase
MSDEKPNSFWDKVSKTDPSFVKVGQVSGQLRTMVDAQYKKYQITKQFGVFGLGWGVVKDSEVYERTQFENSTCILHYRATVFYIHNGERAEFPIAASIRESYITKGGQGYLKIDEEAVKKVRTDALTKGFTDLGFCADIHLGFFDDQAYVDGVTAAKEIEKEDQREEEIEKFRKDINDYCVTQIDSAQKIKSLNAFKSAMKSIYKKVDTRCKAAGVNGSKYLERITEIVTNREEEEKKNAS